MNHSSDNSQTQYTLLIYSKDSIYRIESTQIYIPDQKCNESIKKCRFNVYQLDSNVSTCKDILLLVRRNNESGDVCSFLANQRQGVLCCKAYLFVTNRYIKPFQVATFFHCQVQSEYRQKGTAQRCAIGLVRHRTSIQHIESLCLLSKQRINQQVLCLKFECFVH